MEILAFQVDCPNCLPPYPKPRNCPAFWQYVQLVSKAIFVISLLLDDAIVNPFGDRLKESQILQ
jgi:hypothetical protein